MTEKDNTRSERVQLNNTQDKPIFQKVDAAIAKKRRQQVRDSNSRYQI